MAMETGILFTEKQKFNQWWLWFLLIGINGFMAFAYFWQVAGNPPLGKSTTTDEDLLFSLCITLLVALFLRVFRLETQLKSDGVYVRFFPFRISFKRYSWEEMAKCYIRQYNPISEYGGWGIRFGFFGKGRALNVSGNMGLQLEFTDGKKLLIGTNKPDDLQLALAKTPFRTKPKDPAVENNY